MGKSWCLKQSNIHILIKVLVIHTKIMIVLLCRRKKPFWEFILWRKKKKKSQIEKVIKKKIEEKRTWRKSCDKNYACVKSIVTKVKINHIYLISYTFYMQPLHFVIKFISSYNVLHSGVSNLLQVDMRLNNSDLNSDWFEIRTGLICELNKLLVVQLSFTHGDGV